MSETDCTITPKETKSFLLDKASKKPPRSAKPLAYPANPWPRSSTITGLIAGSDAWKAARCLAITGSDLVVLAGKSTITPLELYNKKKGLEPEFAGSRQMEYGLHLEPLLLKWTQDEYPAHRIEALTLHLASNYNPLHQCTTDGVFWIDGKLPMPLELKTIIFTGQDEWDGESIPEKYNIQIQWQLYITGAPGAYLACLPSGNAYKFVVKSVLADKALQKQLVSLADRFLINLQKSIAPAALHADLKGLASPIEETSIECTPEFVDLYYKYKLAGPDEAKDIKAQMAQMMGEAAVCIFETEGKQVIVSRKVVKVKEKVVAASSYQKVTVKD